MISCGIGVEVIDGEESVVWWRARRSECKVLLDFVRWLDDRKERGRNSQGVLEDVGGRCSCRVIVCYLYHGLVEVLDDASDLFFLRTLAASFHKENDTYFRPNHGLDQIQEPSPKCPKMWLCDREGRVPRVC